MQRTKEPKNQRTKCCSKNSRRVNLYGKILSGLVLWAIVLLGCVYKVNADTGTTWDSDQTVNDNLTINGGLAVTADIKLTIAEGKTLTVNGGIDASGHMMTVEGTGSLIVNGAAGAAGTDAVGEALDGGAGYNGGNGFTGSLIINGADITVNGGNGGTGGDGKNSLVASIASHGGTGGTGGNGVDGSVTINSGRASFSGGIGGVGGTHCHYTGTGGTGGCGVNGIVIINNGRVSFTGGNGGNAGKQGVINGGGGKGGNGVEGNITINSGIASFNGGKGGNGLSSLTYSGNGGDGGSGKGGNGIVTITGGSSTFVGGTGGEGGENYDIRPGHGGKGGEGSNGNVTITGGSSSFTGGSGGSGGVWYHGDYESYGEKGDGGNGVTGDVTFTDSTVLFIGGNDNGKAITGTITTSDAIGSDNKRSWYDIASGSASNYRYVKNNTFFPVTGVTLTPDSATFNIDDTVALSVTVSPDAATDPYIIWSVTGSGVTLYSDAECNNALALDTATGTTTAYMKGTSVGNSKITVKSRENNDIKAECSVTVNPISIDRVEVTDIDAPVAGTELDTLASTSTSHISLGEVSWNPPGLEAAYAKVYTATVTATASAIYVFGNNVAATVNGQAASARKNEDGTLSVSFTFPMTEPDPNPAQSNTGTSTDPDPSPAVVTPVHSSTPVSENIKEVSEPSIITRKNKDGSVTTIRTIRNADGTTTVITETVSPDGTTETKEETRDAKGNGTLKIEKRDAKGNLLSKTEGTIGVNKKGTETIKSITENADGSREERTQKTYKRDANGIKKITISAKKTDAEGNTEKIKRTELIGILGDATVTEKSTYKGVGSDGKTVVTVKEERQYAMSVNGRVKLMSLKTDGEKVTIPESIEVDGVTRVVKSIGKNALKGNQTIKEVKIGKNITTICTGAFKNCKNLELVKLTGSVKKIYKNAFKGIAENAKFVIEASEEDFERIVELIKKSGVSDTVTFERV